MNKINHLLWRHPYCWTSGIQGASFSGGFVVDKQGQEERCVLENFDGTLQEKIKKKGARLVYRNICRIRTATLM